MDKIIKNMNVKPMLERAEFERLRMPENGENVNIRVGDSISLEEVRSDVIKINIARSVVPNPEFIFKIYVEMSAEILVDRKAYDDLANKEDYFKKSPVARALTSHIATLIADMTTNSAIGPVITVPIFQG